MALLFRGMIFFYIRKSQPRDPDHQIFGPHPDIIQIPDHQSPPAHLFQPQLPLLSLADIRFQVPDVTIYNLKQLQQILPLDLQTICTLFSLCQGRFQFLQLRLHDLGIDSFRFEFYYRQPVQQISLVDFHNALPF